MGEAYQRSNTHNRWGLLLLPLSRMVTNDTYPLPFVPTVPEYELASLGASLPCLGLPFP